MVLWGKFASDVSEAMQVRDEHLTVLVLRFAKIKVWKGKIHSFIIIYLHDLSYTLTVILKFLTEERSVSNAYNVSEIGLNPTMIEVGKFIARYFI